jgi:gamma-glutamylcyclotransferase (GGCT)/AIG2-like uncharacterized protein YtfP
MTKVFVYGTLLRDLENSHLLKDSFFIHEVVTCDEYYMVSTETNDSINGYKPNTIEVRKSYRYPCLLESSVSSDHKITLVRGELYEVNSETLKRLDALEDHPTTYERKKIQLNYFKDFDESQTDESLPKCIEAEIYFLVNTDVISDIKSCFAGPTVGNKYKLINNGDFKEFCRSQC